MTISYNWLSEYLPEKIEAEKLSKILTAIGLEVESLEKYEEVKGGLEGLVIGEILDCGKHPDADKLSVTKVDIGSGEPLQIVCGAPNVAIGQKVVVALIGAIIYPFTGKPITIKNARIRGVESFGMICSEDETGLGNDHAGIMILPKTAKPGIPAAAYFGNYNDQIFEIGLTPNRMDAMSHIGVAKDVCAYLSHHNNKEVQIKSPFKNSFKPDRKGAPIHVAIENEAACERYAGISIENIVVADSPKWLQQRLKSIGLRPINNIVDITNFILHETGQPLHAYDADKIAGKKVIVKNLPDNTPFKTLDGKERKLFAEDLMICNSEKAMSIAGVFGGAESGVTATTKNIFLESAWFNPATIRKTSFRHGLRTDAAAHFEKGVDISNTVNVLKRAALMVKEIAKGEIASDITDCYPHPKSKTEVAIKYHYLKKLSGKNYHGDAVKNILTALGFVIVKEGIDDIRVAVPFSKPDISIPADIVEEIMRIDGFDNVAIPSVITIAPAVETLTQEAACKEKVANYLIGAGFNEIFTNSITNWAYFNESILQESVKMINSLSADLNIMRPSMLETGLESIAHNLNRRNNDLKFFEFGKTYTTTGIGKYSEQQHLSLYITGKKNADGWKNKGKKADFYFAKAVFERTTALLGLSITAYQTLQDEKLDGYVHALVKQEAIASIGNVNKKVLDFFDIRQPVLYVDINWDKVTHLNKALKIAYVEMSKFPAVQRDLAIVVDKATKYEQVEKATLNAKVSKLTSVNLFDVFESEKLGAGKKSMAVNFTFLDEEKTMTDKEIDAMMERIIATYEKDLNAEIRK